MWSRLKFLWKQSSKTETRDEQQREEIEQQREQKSKTEPDIPDTSEQPSKNVRFEVEKYTYMRKL